MALFRLHIGMAYLENQDILHRDVAARSMMVGAHHEAKVGGFSLSVQLENNVWIALDGKIVM